MSDQPNRLPDGDELLTIEEVAELTRTTVSALRVMRHRGQGPAGGRLGRRVMYRRSVVLAWIDEHVGTAAH